MSAGRHLIDPGELERCLDKPDLRVVDCRFDLGDPAAGRRAYEKEHIRGAVFADLDNDLSASVGPDTGRHPLPNVEAVANTLGRLGIDKSTEVVVYDDGPGALAARAWWLLRYLGHSRVRLLDGGIEAWKADARPVARGVETAEPRRFRAEPRGDKVISTAELAENIGSIESMNLIDARDAARFRGEVEPIDTVAGHIPGAVSLPYTVSLDDRGRWRKRAQLETLWAGMLGDNRETPWIAMCGSGVTACHLAISALEAGYREPRLYVGSWSEWIRDPARPVGRG